MLCLGGLVHHLRLGIDDCRTALDVVLGGIDVDTRSSEIAVQGQRLIDVVHDVQPHVLVDAAIVAEEVLVVPLEATAHLLLRCLVPLADMLLVAPVVVDIHGQDVLAILFYIRCQVEAEGHDAILAPS